MFFAGPADTEKEMRFSAYYAYYNVLRLDRKYVIFFL